MKLNREFTDYDIHMVHAITRFFETEAGRFLVRSWQFEREQMIQEGIKGRVDETRMKYWAALGGFDRAITLHEQIKSTIKISTDKNNSKVENPFPDLGGEKLVDGILR